MELAVPLTIVVVALEEEELKGIVVGNMNIDDVALNPYLRQDYNTFILVLTS